MIRHTFHLHPSQRSWTPIETDPIPSHLSRWRPRLTAPLLSSWWHYKSGSKSVNTELKRFSQLGILETENESAFW